jgi:PAS domain S-box-containing protein
LGGYPSRPARFTAGGVQGFGSWDCEAKLRHPDAERHMPSPTEIVLSARVLLEAAPDAMVVVDPLGEIVAANMQAEKMFGYTRAQLLGKSLGELIPPKYRASHKQHREAFFRAPQVRTMGVGLKLFALQNGGTEVPVDISLSPLVIESGTFVIASIRDVTEHRLTEAALRESEERLRMATQAGKMFAYEWNAATDKIAHSEGGASILGEDQGTHTGQHILTMLPEEDRERLIAGGTQLSPEKPYLQISHRMVRSDGTMIWVEQSSRAYFDEHGKLLRIVGMLADITDRVGAQEALRQKERELSEAQRVAGVGSWNWDVQKDIVTWSEELYRIVGLDPTLPALSYKDAPRILTSKSLERLHRAVEEALRSGTLDELDLEVIRSDGATRWLQLWGEAVGDTTGSVVRLRGTAQDITERKLSEQAIASMSRKLLEAQEQERARIARELHDDINQRLALLSVEIQRIKEANPITYGELRNRMDELGKRTSEISDVVQSLSHELHSSRLEYLGLVSAMKGFCKEFSDKHKVGIDFDSEGIPPGVPQDVSLCLFRVMQEGLQNALKHSGVKVFEVKVHGSPAEIQLTVRDSGVGFDPELIKDTKGLGLISMQERVRLVKSTISITSKPQSGTEINVRVPLSAGAQTDQAKLAGA